MKKVYIVYFLIMILVLFGLVVDYDSTQNFMITFGFGYAVMDILLRFKGMR